MVQKFEQASYRRHEEEYGDYAKEGRQETIARSWLRTDTVDYWRHARMYACVDPLLEAYPSRKWLTVGDGRYGRDAWYLGQHGAKAVASDISDILLKEGKEAGLIESYSRENAETLSFPDGSFDFVFCKESYHHFPRPMLAIYEMIRVAKTGVILIEPNEAPVIGGAGFVLKRILKRIMLAVGCSARLKTDDTALITYGNSYEESGNYVYALSEREIIKVALGLNFPAVAFKGLNDWYQSGLEDELLTMDSSALKKVKSEIQRADKRAARGLSLGTSIQLVACIFKTKPSSEARETLCRAGFRVVDLPRNPYIPSVEAIS
jgi:ubiquinone/menaquinone biosynthesis C-methylase UbiE